VDLTFGNSASAGRSRAGLPGWRDSGTRGSPDGDDRSGTPCGHRSGRSMTACIDPFDIVAIVRSMRNFPVASGSDVITEEETKTEESLDVPWNVVVHNDPINLMDYVTKVFMKVFGFSRQKAEVHMVEVHQKGRSVVWTGARERAEFYVQQLHLYLLLATIEKSR
jgi:ATP-dependent Clp protease adaptor protein ClpS